MPRKLRVEYPDVINRVMNRGGGSEPVFNDDADRQCFIESRRREID